MRKYAVFSIVINHFLSVKPGADQLQLGRPEKTKRIFLFSAMLLSAVCTYTQTIDEAQKNRILENNGFFLMQDIPLGDYDFENTNLNIALASALNHRGKKSTFSVVGGSFLAAGAVSLVSGLAVNSRAKRNPSVLGGPIEQTFADFLMIGGLTGTATGITFLSFSGSQNRNMQRSLERAREIHRQMY